MEKAVFTNMCMLTDPSGNVLIQQRLDPKWPGVTFPGGHVLPGESFQSSVIREVFEETGLTVAAPSLCGIKQFPTDSGERYVVLLYRASRFTGVLRGSEEGPVRWTPLETLDTLPLAPGFDAMLKVFLSPEWNEVYLVKAENHWETYLL